MTWTRFMDMHSGGGQKHDFATIYIEAPKAEAKAVFYARFGTSPDRVTCTCCGEDYSTTESPTLAEASAYDRNLRYIKPEWAVEWAPLDRQKRIEANRLTRHLEVGEDVPDGYVLETMFMSQGADPIPLDVFAATERLIRADEITDAERATVVPDQGYVWVD